MIGYYVPVYCAPHTAWRPSPADVPREISGPYASIGYAELARARIDTTWHAEWGGVAVTGDVIVALTKEAAAAWLALRRPC